MLCATRWLCTCARQHIITRPLLPSAAATAGGHVDGAALGLCTRGRVRHSASAMCTVVVRTWTYIRCPAPVSSSATFVLLDLPMVSTRAPAGALGLLLAAPLAAAAAWRCVALGAVTLSAPCDL